MNDATRETPRLVLGLVSDSHLRTDMDGRSPGTTDRYFRAALELFRDSGVDAVAHCGDMADRGQTAELEFHARIWNEVFPGDIAPDGRKVERLFVTGNHDVEGFRYGLGCPFRVDVPFPDPEETTRHLLAADMAAEWERVWGERYEPVWHRVVRGFHFFGLHWGEDEALLAKAIGEFSTQRRRDGEDELSTIGNCQKRQMSTTDTNANLCASAALREETNPDGPPLPFFVIAHDRPEAPERLAAAGARPGFGFFGHYHRTAANANVVHEFDGCTFPWVQVPSCSIYGDLLFGGDEWISPVPIDGAQAAKKGYQCLVVRVYDDRIAIERHEISEGGRLGPDWVLPVGDGENLVEKLGLRQVEKLKVEKLKGGSSLREALKRCEGVPQFRDGAKLEVAKCCQCENVAKFNFQSSIGNNDIGNWQQSHNGDIQNLRIGIPLADGNPPCRAYAYEVEVATTPPSSHDGGPESASPPLPLRKAIYAAGVHMGAGHEPDGGTTAIEIPADELPPGRLLRISARPVSSLGARGRDIVSTF